jgi:hypothetical protein
MKDPIRDLKGYMTENNPSTPVPHFRQGDILLLRVEAIHEKAKPVKANGPIILAEGEATGHHHAVYETEGVTLYRRRTGEMFLEVAKPEAEVRHPEHGPITLPEGRYEVLRQREYDPERIRRVLD